MTACLRFMPFNCLRWAARWLIPSAAAMLISGCNPFARDVGADMQVSSLFEEIIHHQTDAFTERFAASLQDSKSLSQIAAIERMLPPGEPRRRIEVSTNTVTLGGYTTVLATDQYDYDDRAALVQTRLYGIAGSQQWLIQGFHVQVATFDQLKANDFALAGKSAGQYAFLSLLVASPLLVVAAIVKVLRTAGLRRKWLWCLAAVFAVGTASMNWATGALSMNPLAFQLFGCGFMKAQSSFAPWTLAVSLPIGAVLILVGVWGTPKMAQAAIP
jgi:hypothetical protein